MESSTPFSGDNLRTFDRFQIKKELGRGGMGVVYLVYDPVLKRDVALKTVLSQDSEGVRRFLHEAKTMAKLNHPNIVKIYDIGQDGETPYFTMEFIEGKNLAELVQKEKIASRRAVELVRKVAQAIDYAHKEGILHRDLKPANIILNKQGDPIVMDFGLAKDISGNSRLSKSGVVIGTPAYMPPEQAQGKRKEIDQRSDVYSLGAVLYELLTGRPPFLGTTYTVLMQVIDKTPIAPRAISPIISQDIENICLKAMAKEKERRYRTALELVLDLERFLHGEAVMAMPKSWKYQTSKWLEKNRLLVAAASVCLLVLIFSGIFSYWQIRKESREAEVARRAAVTNYSLLQLEIADKKWCEGNQQTALLHYARIVTEAEKNKLPEEILRLARLRLAHYSSSLISCRHVLYGHTNQVNALAVSPDGKLLATASSDKTIRLYALNTLQHKATLQGHTDAIYTLAFDPSGSKLASGSEDRTIRIWNWATGQTENILQGHQGAVYSVAFSPTAPILASGSQDSRIYLWDIHTQTPAKVFNHKHWVRSVAFSPDGKELVSGCYDRTVRLWNIQTGAERVLMGHTSVVFSVAFSPDGQMVASGSYDQTGRLWDVKTASTISILGEHSDRLQAVAFSSDGKTLASAGWDRVIWLWDVDTRSKKCLLSGGQKNITALTFARDSKTLVSGSEDGVVRLWNVTPNNTKAVRRGHEAPVTSVAFSPDGTKLASVGRDSGTLLWNVATGSKKVYVPANISWIFSVAFHPDGKTLAIATHNHDLQKVKSLVILMDEHLVEQGRLEGTCRHKNCLSFSPHGKWLATSIDEHQLSLYDLQKKVSHHLEGYRGETHELAFSPDGKLLVSGSTENAVLVWDVSKKLLKSKFQGHSQEVVAIAMSPDGKIVASGSLDTTIRLWEMPGGMQRNCLKGHTARINGLAFSPDGTILASGSDDSTVRLWDVKTGYLQAIFQTGSTTAVVFSPDGKTLATGGYDHLVRLWKIMDAPEFLTLPAKDIEARITKVLGLGSEETK